VSFKNRILLAMAARWLLEAENGHIKELEIIFPVRRHRKGFEEKGGNRKP